MTANAIIHRNTGLAGPVLVKAFTTRVEVVSLGGLNGLAPDDLLNGVSLPVNPALFDRFVTLGYAHGTGSGLARVMECYEGTGITATVSATANSVRLILPRASFASGNGRVIRFPETRWVHSMSGDCAF
ncbi:ATP-binding protein [uncultured Bifidobacterium sp.]|uniref:ATP-binding protein n=1 Tax=uncultured Bifidobacterium sp. TaxID=165187 RepID=UPI002593D487|nr:ATP-binding protein [uncultured Bifidobacterium sp.]